MLYHLHAAQEAWSARLRPVAREAAGWLRRLGDRPGVAQAAAALQLLEEVGTTHRKPEFGLDRIRAGNRVVPVREEVVQAAPFGRLLRFAKDAPRAGPPVLVVAPLSGHYATRVRDTIAALLPEHDVHVTDWTDARLVPAAAGRFGLDALVAQIIAWLEAIGPGAHALTVSQPAAAALAAAALMAEDGNPARPRSLTLIAGPIDARISPSREGALVRALPAAWFEAMEVATVPPPFPGAGRRVRPGAQQITGSVLAELPTQVAAQLTQLRNLTGGDAAAAAAHRRHNDELRAVMDVPAELYLDTIHRVFRAAELARGRMAWRGRPVRPEAIRDTALLVVEGGADTTCPAGQTRPALALCCGLPQGLRQHHLQPGAGHGALFEGPAWRAEILPLVAAVIREADRSAAAAAPRRARR
ncbi:polyhydroxyalkanoate depolymerase [Paracraurococcus lichenis]|uniref:Polyhydroxyalkanoate depolymerase n=1 Tax=Paracraurococcus lichenis TaxID=3064888 RepID=A0ABT9E7F3_9PROT|nr:polyhydroxyalkanoate depolymerase [Paracraurococcus sp. LOR1-02]MDO9712108.1 polyhydroxyalkanoate depolymerase [Paracraurococcus sp. LOR1-02]